MTTKIKSNEIVLSRNIWTGHPDAAIRVVEFGDYQSEACATVHEVVKQLLITFEGKIKFNFRHFPLSQVHQHAMKAAEAAVAAAQMGRFWEMHETLFANRRHLGTISLKGYARESGITDKRFLDNLVNSVYSWQVRDDLMEGLQNGVREVPAFFINQERYTGGLSLENMREYIEGLLR